MAKKEQEGKDDDKDVVDKGEDIVIVTDDPKDLPPTGGLSADDDDDGGDYTKPIKKEAKKKVGEPEDADDEEDEAEEPKADKRVGASEDDEDEEEEPKRPTHKTRRQRRREAEMRLRTERDFLAQRNEQLEKQIQAVAKRQDQLDKSTLEDRIAQTEAFIRRADGVIAEAITNSKGDEAAEATTLRDNAKERLRDLKAAKAEAEERGDARPPPDPRAVARAQAWHKDNAWFDFGRRDYDSRIAGAIDDSLYAEGYNPATQEYWDELDRRIAKQLPERVGGKKKTARVDDGLDHDEDEDEDEQEERPVKKKSKVNGKKPGLGGPKFRSGGPGRDLKANEVYLSRERIQAMQEAGVWDDPVLRAKYLKQYRKYDQEHPND